MKVEARDRDDPNTLHAELRYGQLDQTPRIPSSQMFFINPRTGDISLTEEGELCHAPLSWYWEPALVKMQLQIMKPGEPVAV